MDADYVDAIALKGKIDHSTAGAQLIWEALSKCGKNGEGKICGQILGLCVALHHSGLIDCLTPEGVDGFNLCINKDDERALLMRIFWSKPKIWSTNIDVIHAQADKTFTKNEQHGQAISEAIKCFYIGFWTRFFQYVDIKLRRSIDH